MSIVKLSLGDREFIELVEVDLFWLLFLSIELFLSLCDRRRGQIEFL